MSPKKSRKSRGSKQKPKPRKKSTTPLKASVPVVTLSEPLVIQYDSLKAIHEMGFVISAEVMILPALQEKMISKGLLPSRPVKGYMIVDTGASMTALSKRAISRLNIHPTSSINTHSVHGTAETFVYYACVRVGEGPHALFRTGQFAEVNLEGELIERYEKQNMEIVGLLGRDYFEGKILTCDFKKAVMTISWGS